MIGADKWILGDHLGSAISVRDLMTTMQSLSLSQLTLP